ncbi:NACHT and WD40 domain-containing protein [Coprinopsis cinerea okayama7|uniref:NACHT and WD40 domain-containing protein n=1 Tax=Coprinopsis cinerea (strain Okayama-7 / 130 / ATCC MYA-4618 / FGSC 9003) TaxID=240176 RepID=A8P271_COPC7|nr:NACHT and WD40 domain-containing protein [Coprinopsis cinerea okayama7\|eukprot:XP_001838254.2 NACHT and WD40 domain-containing protein [Coprinopsis cinerea okayama7\
MPILERAHNLVINGGTFNDFSSSHGLEPLAYLEQYAASGATYDSAERYPPPRCHELTRVRVLGVLKSWVEQPREEMDKRSFWLHAPVAMGKTTIAQTLAEECETMGNLGASFFFSRVHPERSRARHFVASLALQLAVSIPQLKPHIEAAIVGNPTILSKSLPIQLQKLIIGPFMNIPLLKEDKIVLIDALDECEGANPVEDREGEQRLVLELIQTIQEADLPLKVAIFSRPESWIEEAFEDLETLDENTERYDLFNVSEKYDDVERYLRDHFQRIRKAKKHRHAMSQIQDPWPSEHKIKKLVKLSCGQFGYVATVIRFVDDPYGSPQERLELILQGSSEKSHKALNPMQQLDDLYRRILGSCPNREEMMQAVGWLMAARRPLLARHHAVPMYDKVIAGQPGAMTRALRGLRAIVHIPPERPDPTPVAYHNSFWEFLESPSRGGEFHCNRHYWFVFATSRCLKFLSSSAFADYSDGVTRLAADLWPHGFSALLDLVPEENPKHKDLCQFFVAQFLLRDVSIDLRLAQCDHIVNAYDVLESILQSARHFLDQPSITHDCLSHWRKCYAKFHDDWLGNMSSEGRLYLDRLCSSFYALTLDSSAPHAFEWRPTRARINRPSSHKVHFEGRDITSVLACGPGAYFYEPESTLRRILALSPVVAIYQCLPTQLRGIMEYRFQSLQVSPAEVCNRLWDLLIRVASHDWDSTTTLEIQYAVCTPLLRAMLTHVFLLDSTEGLDFLASPSKVMPTLRRAQCFHIRHLFDHAIVALIFQKNVELALALLDFCDAIEHLVSEDDMCGPFGSIEEYRPLYEKFRSDPYGFVNKF